MICDAPNCVRPATRKMLCTQHYQRMRLRGSVENGGERIRGEGETFEQRFWSRVALTANDQKCWNWLGSAERCGRLSKGRKHIQAHVAAFELVNGYIPTNILRHTCDNPLCVNPNHLLEGTNADNSRDAMERGRIPVGSRSGVAKLTEADIPSIREMRKHATALKVAESFGVGRTTINAIIDGKTWTHV